MSEAIDYAKMSEIPVSSCEICVENKPSKKKDAKNKVINKINKDLTQNKKVKFNPFLRLKGFFKDKVLKFKKSKPKQETTKEQEQKNRGFDVVSAQVITIFVLVISILLTNVFWEDSAINVFFKNMFNKNQEVSLNYTDFNPTLPMTEVPVSLTDGVMTASGEGNVYAPVGGQVESVTKVEDGTYCITISHTEKFKTVLEGIDYPYFEKGNTVYTTCPIGYSNKNLTVKMYNGEDLITNYTFNDGAIVWE
ncbi:MAG: hypothetical protein J6C97_03160 [Clostridia bacterium]|nr:hypothetical protein [Clostridia bacterium]